MYDKCEIVEEHDDMYAAEARSMGHDGTIRIPCEEDGKYILVWEGPKCDENGYPDVGVERTAERVCQRHYDEVLESIKDDVHGYMQCDVRLVDVINPIEWVVPISWSVL